MCPLFKNTLLFIVAFLPASVVLAQTASIEGTVSSNGLGVAAASIRIIKSTTGAAADSAGHFKIDSLLPGAYTLSASRVGYLTVSRHVHVGPGEMVLLDFEMLSTSNSMDEVVITGTLKEVKRMESPVPVEVYSPAYFKKNPTPNIFDALQNVNGVRPQLNCNVCNTGDIHINGLEGPYTMVLIDGMPIVSSLSTVYGLSGIPNSLVERIEIVKGPASSLYGSEAVGGLINIITKNANTAPAFSADVFTTSWQEWNADLGFKVKAGSKATALTGINLFKYRNIVDNNNDGFTDVTLQERFSVFQKWNFKRSQNRQFSLAGRYFNEERWGGDIRWNKSFRGGDSIYGESIYTNRIELLGNYQLPLKEKFLLSFSYNNHEQDSRYGTTSYIAQQRIAFSQLTWDKTFANHDMLAGMAMRYTFYDDNSVATAGANHGNRPQKVWLPGIFVQDEITLAAKHKLLLGMRYDYNSQHGNIFTPRFAYKWSVNDHNIIRLNAGTGFRVVNLFTEDHAALTGARTVEIANALKPEKTYNVNLNFLKKIVAGNGVFIGLDITGWYTYFNNRIIGDYDSDPNKIIYDNLSGHAQSKGVSANVDVAFNNGLKILAGATLQDVSTVADGVKQQQILTEKVTGTWAVSYKIKRMNLALDYTGNIYGPMRLPLLGPLDPRQPYSPTWSVQNIQLLYSGFKNWELYAGVKNLLNFTPNRGNPFIIARSNDPFDKRVQYTADGRVQPTAENPYALTFDPNYMYAPNQGLRGFVGLRVKIN
ncbi:MAG: TonB-dependent receptor [Sphingobacteriales bacterium]|nr:MAG: TonB-dependent receptor [Sphingobacteriales bacterium]